MWDNQTTIQTIFGLRIYIFFFFGGGGGGGGVGGGDWLLLLFQLSMKTGIKKSHAEQQFRCSQCSLLCCSHFLLFSLN